MWNRFGGKEIFLEKIKFYKNGVFELDFYELVMNACHPPS